MSTRKISRRRFLALAAGMGAAAVGCGGRAPTPTPPAPSPTPTPLSATASPTPTVISRPPTGPLSVLVVGDPFQYALEKLLPQFTESTGIRVKMETLSYDALNARLSSSFVGNTTPADVITVDQMWNGQYFDNKWIRPLDDLIKGDA